MEHNRRQGVVAAYGHSGSIVQDTLTVYNRQGDLQQQLKALWRKYSRRHPGCVLRTGDFKSRHISSCLFLSYALHFRRLVVEATDMGLFLHIQRNDARPPAVRTLSGG